MHDPALTKYNGLGAGASLPYYAREHNGNFIPYGELPPYYSRLEQGAFVPYGDYVYQPVTPGMAGYGAEGGGCGLLTILTAIGVGFLAGVLSGTAQERKIFRAKVLEAQLPKVP
jgi:hypothetical protein